MVSPVLDASISLVMTGWIFVVSPLGKYNGTDALASWKPQSKTVKLGQENHT